MNKTDRLKQIRAEMGRALALGDKETAHGAGDDLLLITIRTLSRSTKHEPECLKIIAMFQRMEKWYA